MSARQTRLIYSSDGMALPTKAIGIIVVHY